MNERFSNYKLHFQPKKQATKTKIKQMIQIQIGIENDLNWKSQESRLSDIN